MEIVTLRPKEEKRVLLGHPWIFSNEIEPFPNHLAPGSLVDVQSHGGKYLGRGYFNPHSLIAVRLLTRRSTEINDEFFKERIVGALSLRKNFYGDGQCYRMIYSEGDWLPGFIVDRYGNMLAFQSLTAGMERLVDRMIPILVELINPVGIIARCDGSTSELEGLEKNKRVYWGSYPSPIQVERDGIRYEVDLMEGQKTGLYLDQMENYQSLKGLVQGARVLDVFSYLGGWSISAARWGARRVEGIDSSEWAIRGAARNAELNHLGETCRFIKSEAFEFLKKESSKNKQYDCIILDPPAFVKRKKRLKEGLRGYFDLNACSMSLIKKGGFLITSSCSHHIDRTEFEAVLVQAARKARRKIRILEFRGQSRDHPILPAAKETEYLKCVVLQVV